MGVPLDLRGVKLGRLIGVEPVDRTPQGVVWRFLCECGRLREATAKSVKSGHIRSCGCLASEVRKTHGHAVGGISRTYRAWRAAKTRCFNPNWWAYDRYGGRGITMCPQWVSSFETFLNDMGECPEGFTIDRIDNDGNYEPSNCRWASAAEQHVAKTGVHTVLHRGTRMNLAQYAAARGVSYSALWGRVKGNWPDPVEAADAILAKKRKRRPTYSPSGFSAVPARNAR
jgi:hypothetical protein